VAAAAAGAAFEVPLTVAGATLSAGGLGMSLAGYRLGRLRERSDQNLRSQMVLGLAILRCARSMQLVGYCIREHAVSDPGFKAWVDGSLSLEKIDLAVDCGELLYVSTKVHDLVQGAKELGGAVADMVELGVGLATLGTAIGIVGLTVKGRSLYLLAREVADGSPCDLAEQMEQLAEVLEVLLAAQGFKTGSRQSASGGKLGGA